MELVVKIISATTRKREAKETTGTSEGEVRYIVPDDFPDTEVAKSMKLEFTSMVCALFGGYGGEEVQ